MARAIRKRQGAATAILTKPTSRGPAELSRARSVMVAPVVPQEIAARQMRRRPTLTERDYT